MKAYGTTIIKIKSKLSNLVHFFRRYLVILIKTNKQNKSFSACYKSMCSKLL